MHLWSDAVYGSEDSCSSGFCFAGKSGNRCILAFKWHVLWDRFVRSAAGPRHVTDELERPLNLAVQTNLQQHLIHTIGAQTNAQAIDTRVETRIPHGCIRTNTDPPEVECKSQNTVNKIRAIDYVNVVQLGPGLLTGSSAGCFSLWSASFKVLTRAQLCLLTGRYLSGPVRGPSHGTNATARISNHLPRMRLLPWSSHRCKTWFWLSVPFHASVLWLTHAGQYLSCIIGRWGWKMPLCLACSSMGELVWSVARWGLVGLAHSPVRVYMMGFWMTYFPHSSL